MSWTNQQNNNSGELKTIWQYKEGVDFLTVLPNTTVDLILIQDDNDPTRTWNYPIDAWTHEFKGSNGFVTVICNKWNEACPFCYENELFKQANPNYKQNGQRLPYGLSRKALIQAYVVQEGRVVWLLAGKQIQDGMDFVISRQTTMGGSFNGIISITRLGQGLNTNYRVDPSTIQITPEIQQAISQQAISFEDASARIILSHKEIYDKSGIDPYQFFQMKQQQGITVDISNWGSLPKQVIQNQQPISTPIQQPIQNPGQAPAVSPVQNQNIQQLNQVPQPTVVLPDEVKNALEFKCESGIYKGQSMQDVITQTGKTYLAFLNQKGTDNEQRIVQLLIANIDDVNKYIEQMLPF